MRIALIAQDPSFGNCVGLYKSLSLNHDVTAIFDKRDKKKMWREIPHILNIRHRPKRVDHYIIVGAACFDILKTIRPSFLPQEGNEQVTVILNDSRSYKHIEEVQHDLQNYRLICMADLAPFYNCVDIYYHPFEYKGEIRKNKNITIAHSPFSRAKKFVKGTRWIMKVVDAIGGVDLDVIEGVSWRKSIERKSRAHIFIDQAIAPAENGYLGALGKSGVEGMATECLTMSSGRFWDERASIPTPPAISITRESLKSTLEYYIENKQERQEIALKQKQWVEEYLNYEAVALRIDLQLAKVPHAD